MPQMVCQRDYTLRTTTGHVIAFKANTPRNVPNECVEAAMAVNIIPVSGGFAERKPDEHVGPTRIAAMSAEMREAILLHTIHELVRDADVACFDAGGKPKVHAIRQRCGLDVDTAERSRLWDKYRDIKASNSDLPAPRNVDLVLEVQACNTHKTLIEYLEMFGHEASEFRGWTLKEIKGAAVTAAINYKEPAYATAAPEGEDVGQLDESA